MNELKNQEKPNYRFCENKKQKKYEKCCQNGTKNAMHRNLHSTLSLNRLGGEERLGNVSTLLKPRFNFVKKRTQKMLLK